MSRDRQALGEQQPSGTGRWGILTVSLATVSTSLVLAGCEGRAGSRDLMSGWEPLDASGPLAIRLEDVWRYDVSQWVDSFGGVAAWSDGVIWIGERRSERIWELSVGTGSVQLIRDDGEAAEGPGGTLGMALAQQQWMYILGSSPV